MSKMETTKGGKVILRWKLRTMLKDEKGLLTEQKETVKRTRKFKKGEP